MTNELLSLLDDETERCTKPLSISASESLVQKYRDVGELTKKAFGRNRVPAAARLRLFEMLDEVEALALEKIREKTA